ncbi:hypothetical protein Micbo1qcDRAFT_215014 [Microdochium bolleyi]|uniref:F-box domain-containing protein n=1 Tax=Microdochium bolleyi TaxID=196109 RepID=A0A136ISQ5_9PEZI|nr:hypothetical protein Micbo1qcDRAFT_215014 [Microdochium bolleyi]
MTLASLPTEVLQQIVSATRPSGFESALLACRRMHQAGKMYVAEHNEYRRGFRDVVVRARDDRELVRELGNLLRAIAANPSVAGYVRSLAVEKRHEEHNATGSSDAPSSGDYELVSEMIRESPWLRAAGCDLEAWQGFLTPMFAEGEDEADDDDDDSHNQYANLPAVLPLFTLLLTQVTHLETLTIAYNLHLAGHHAEDDPTFSQAKTVLDLMSLRISGGSDSPATHKDDSNSEDINSTSKRSAILARVPTLPVSPLENLADVHYCPPVGYHQRKPVGSVDPFIASPRVRRLVATSLQSVSLDGYNYDWPMAWEQYVSAGDDEDADPAKHGGEGKEEREEKERRTVVCESSSLLAPARQFSAVEHLDLVGACMDDDGIKNVLSHMPRLQTLRLTHEAKFQSVELDFDAGWFLMAVADPYGYDGYPSDGIYVSESDVEWDDDDDDEEEEEEEQEEEGGGIDPNVDDERNHSDAEDEGEGGKDVENNDDDLEKQWNDIPLGQRLKTLAIHFEQPFHGYIITGVQEKTMRKFTALETLAVDVRIFFGPNPKTGERMSADYQAPMLDGADCWDPEGDVPRLIDMLPETLQDLELFVDMADDHNPMMEHWARLLSGFAEARAERLPNLKSFVVRERSPPQWDAEAHVWREVLPGDNEGMVRNRSAAEAAGAQYQGAVGACASWRDVIAFKERIFEVDEVGEVV